MKTCDGPFGLPGRGRKTDFPMMTGPVGRR